MRHRAGTAVFGAVALLAAGCTGGGGVGDPADQENGGGSAAPSTSAGRLVPPGDPADVATGLEVPWSTAFLPEGGALVSERDSARIVRVGDDGGVDDVGRVKGVEPQGEGGLLGIAVSPGFRQDSFVYAYFTGAEDNRIVRMTYDPEDGLGGQKVILDGIPSAGHHNGGRIAFGPDGMLYAATGDAGDDATSQDTGSLGGKILRMTPEGDPAEDNPFDNLVYSFGHRNVQGLAWDEKDRLFGIEFGQNTYDEVNLIEPGGNYGWPEVEGVGDDAEYVDPVVTWDTGEASPSGAAIAGGSLWVAALRGERLWRVPLTGDVDDPVAEPEALFVGEFGRLRSVDTAPGGAEIWMSTSNRDGRGTPKEGDDRILRVPLGE